MSPTLHAPVYTLYIELEEIEPPIWRRVEVPASFTLRRLHDVIQVAMGWMHAHLHLFEIDGARYGFGDNEWDDSELDDSQVLLGDVVQHVGDVFSYEYDFGDDWKHIVLVEQIRRDVPRENVPRLLDGRRACPPEDCGGPPGYEELLEETAYLDPEAYDVAAHDARLEPLRRPDPLLGEREAELVAELHGVLAQVQREIPALPRHIIETAVMLLHRIANTDADEFLRARNPAVWAAAALHASFVLHPRWSYHPLSPLTLKALSQLFDVSARSIGARSRQLRDGVTLHPLLR
jgi:hypothetical protein